MRAAIFRQGDIVVDTIADPVLGEGQVLVRRRCCGICGSDLHAAKYTDAFVDVASAPAAAGHGRTATSCSAMNSSARSWPTDRGPRAATRPAPSSPRCR